MEFEDWRWRSSARGYGSIVLSDFLNDDILEMNCKILEMLSVIWYFVIDFSGMNCIMNNSTTFKNHTHDMETVMKKYHFLMIKEGGLIPT